MILADIIVLGLIVISCVLGMLFGFGKGLKFVTGGITGVIISIFICYMLGGIIYNFAFVQNGLESLRGALANKGNKLCKFLLIIQIDILVYYVALFIAVTIVRIIIVHIIKSIVEIENVALIVINKTFGVVLFAAVSIILVLFVFWIVSLIGGGTAVDLEAHLSKSSIGLGWLYEHNPFMKMIIIIKARV